MQFQQMSHRQNRPEFAVWLDQVTIGVDRSYCLHLSTKIQQAVHIRRSQVLMLV